MLNLASVVWNVLIEVLAGHVIWASDRYLLVTSREAVVILHAGMRASGMPQGAVVISYLQWKSVPATSLDIVIAYTALHWFVTIQRSCNMGCFVAAVDL